MRVRDYLSVPYLVECSSVESSNGEWVRLLTCPELPGCVGEGTSLTGAWLSLERRRIDTILGMLSRGDRPPVPRPPLYERHVLAEVTESTLSEWLAQWLDLDEEECMGKKMIADEPPAHPHSDSPQAS